MTWTIVFRRSVQKALPDIPKRVRKLLAALASDIESSGPVRGDWPNYSRLSDGSHHCHLKKGHPTYVAVWSETSGKVVVEVIYVGTHENAPF